MPRQAANAAPAHEERVRPALIVLAAVGLAGCSLGPSSPALPPSHAQAVANARRASGFRVLHSFGVASSDGAQPSAPLIVVGNRLYGTTVGGGSAKLGTVFSLTPQGRVVVLHSFTGASDGAYPTAGLLDLNGVLYGTTSGSGDDNGTVFAITPQGSEKTIYAFQGGGDGADPIGGLTSLNGALCGTTARGGKNDVGTVFRLSLRGKKEILHSFSIGEGDQPGATLLALRGGLFGTARLDGKHHGGAAFRVDASKHFKVLHYFGGLDDGSGPSSGLVFANGLLYGTTPFGGGNSSHGTVFSLTLSGGEHIVHRFESRSGGGYNAIGGLSWRGGIFHGTTAGTVGSGQPGTIYRLSPSGKFATLHVFAHQHGGQYPNVGVTPFNGSLYGATLRGGSANLGTVYVFRP